MTDPILAPAGAALAADPTPRPKDAAEAAKQFEALLIGQMLRTAHESADASLSGEKDSTEETMWDVAAQQFSQLLANQGGIGLAKMITERLKRPGGPGLPPRPLEPTSGAGAKAPVAG